MMDFARRQLEKYGWSDGKGLGRREDGIPEPLRPKLKRSVAGVGHEAAAELNDHWWSALYDKAAANVEVSGRTEITIKDRDAVEISSNTWRINKKKKCPGASGYMENFVRTAVLTSGGVKTERLRDESDSDDEHVASVPHVTDEQLFAACGGRTAHKGARHGLRAIGKLARIEHQEKSLLKLPQYKGYSHAEVGGNEGKNTEKPEKEEAASPKDNTSFDYKPLKNKSKKKKSKRKEDTEVVKDEIVEEVSDDFEKPAVKKNKKRKIVESTVEETVELLVLPAESKEDNNENEEGDPGKKSKKNKRNMEITEEIVGGIVKIGKHKKKKKNIRVFPTATNA